MFEYETLDETNTHRSPKCRTLPCLLFMQRFSESMKRAKYYKECIQNLFNHDPTPYRVSLRTWELWNTYWQTCLRS